MKRVIGVLLATTAETATKDRSVPLVELALRDQKETREAWVMKDARENAGSLVRRVTSEPRV